MNARFVAILVLLLIVLGGGALLLKQREAAERAPNSAALGQRLFKDLKAADIAAIRISQAKSSLTLERKKDGWTIAERDGFPADLGKVRDFVLKAIGLEVGQSAPIGDKDRARLKLDASGTQLEFDAAQGKALAKATIGKKYFKREPENPEKATGDGRFVMLPGHDATVYIVSDPLTQASTRTADWIDRAAFKVEKVKTLEVRYPDGSGYRIEREADNADWKLAGAKPGEKLEVTKANSASYSLSLLDLADVAPKDAADTGLDKPVLISATTLGGASYEIKVGRLQGDNYYVSYSTSSTEPRDQLLSRYILLIPKSKLEDTLKKHADLLEKKPEAKK